MVSLIGVYVNKILLLTFEILFHFLPIFASQHQKMKMTSLYAIRVGATYWKTTCAPLSTRWRRHPNRLGLSPSAPALFQKERP